MAMAPMEYSPSGTAPGTAGAGFTELGQTYAASVTLNLARALRPLFEITLTGNVTMLAPINGSDGQVFAIRFKQSNGGGWAVTWDSSSNWRGSDTSALPTLTGSTTKPDIFGFVVNGDDDKFDYLAGIKGLL